MKKPLFIASLFLWTAFFLVIGATVLSEFTEWETLSSHLRNHLIFNCVFLPLAWIVGMLKIWSIFYQGNSSSARLLSDSCCGLVAACSLSRAIPLAGRFTSLTSVSE